MTKAERELVQSVIDAFNWHDKMKHGKSMARLREAVSQLDASLNRQASHPPDKSTGANS